MRFKRVSNYSKFNSQEAFILEKSEQGLRGDQIIEALLENFPEELDRNQAIEMVRKVANELEIERGVRKSDIKIKNNPGFKTTISLQQETGIITILTENINNINYLYTLPIYLDTIIRLMAPIAPFFCDQIFRNLNSVTKKYNFTSIHHTPFPKAELTKIDTALENRMQMAQDICSLVLSIRKKVNIKVRQPLQKILIPVLDPATKTAIELMQELILAEVNVKEINYITETEGVIRKKLKANFKLLGAKLGTKMKQASSVIAQLTQTEISHIIYHRSVLISYRIINSQLSSLFDKQACYP